MMTAQAFFSACGRRRESRFDRLDAGGIQKGSDESMGFQALAKL